MADTVANALPHPRADFRPPGDTVSSPHRPARAPSLDADRVTGS